MIKTTVDYKKIGERIRKQRDLKGLTQEQLASSLNITSFYLSKIENGKVSATLETLAVIANTLEIDLALLITGTSTLEKQNYVDDLHSICNKANRKQLDLIIKLAKAVIED